MKLVMLPFAVSSLGFIFACNAVCQQMKPQPERPYLVHTESPRLYFTIPSTENTGRVELTAAGAQRDLSTQRDSSGTEAASVLQLRGNVEVMMCPPGGHGCDKGSIVLRADAVDFNEKTGEMDAHGNVHIDPYRSQLQK